MQTTEPTPQAAPHGQVLTLPALQPGERYAGIALDDAGDPTHHLVKLAARPPTRLNHQDATDWAASVGGTLPTCQELALLFANCKAHLERTWTWSCETHADDASSAWFCYFHDGILSGTLKSYEGSAVAVRRLPLNSFNPLDAGAQ